MNQRREISFLLTVEDHIAFNRVVHRRLPFGQRHLSLFLIGGASLLSIFLLFKVASNTGDGRPQFSFALGGFILLLALLGGLAWRVRPSQIPHRVRDLLAKPQNRHMVGEKTVRIGPEGITVQAQDAQTTVRWDVIEDVKVTDDHAFFFFAQRAAVILPRRPFPSEDEFRAFLKLARRLYEGESDREPQPESFSPEPIRDAEFGSKTAPKLSIDGGRTAACRDLSFVLTVEDHIAFNNLLYQRLPFWRRHLASMVIGVIVPPFVAYVFFFTPGTPWPPQGERLLIDVLIVMGSIVAAVVVPIITTREQAKKRAQAVRTLLAHPQNQKLVGETTIRITPEEVISQSMTGTSSLRWERIHEIVVTADHAFFFYAERNAITIPKRPRQAEEFEEFVDLARQYHEGSLSSAERAERAQEAEQEYRIKE
jgi:hypothetical protein